MHLIPCLPTLHTLSSIPQLPSILCIALVVDIHASPQRVSGNFKGEGSGKSKSVKTDVWSNNDILGGVGDGGGRRGKVQSKRPSLSGGGRWYGYFLEPRNIRLIRVSLNQQRFRN